MAPIRVMVVEDSLPFRQFICKTVANRPDLQIICEVGNGLQAVQKAEQLKADVIFLDIGLPTLNGIAAARQIRKLVPKSKIVFVSQESDADIVQQALGFGAWGYVLKSRAASDLLAAVEAACEGRHFVSGGLSGQFFTDASRQPPVAIMQP